MSTFNRNKPQASMNFSGSRPPYIVRTHLPERKIDEATIQRLFLLVDNGEFSEIKKFMSANTVSLSVQNEMQESLLHVVINSENIVTEEEKLLIVKYLTGRGAKVNAYDKNNMTPLHLAAKKQYPQIVKYLLDHGADPNFEDNRKMTPLHYAIQGNIQPCVTVESMKPTDIVPNKSKKTDNAALDEMTVEIARMLFQDININRYLRNISNIFNDVEEKKKEEDTEDIDIDISKLHDRYTTMQETINNYSIENLNYRYESATRKFNEAVAEFLPNIFITSNDMLKNLNTSEMQENEQKLTETHTRFFNRETTIGKYKKEIKKLTKFFSEQIYSSIHSQFAELYDEFDEYNKTLLMILNNKIIRGNNKMIILHKLFDFILDILKAVYSQLSSINNLNGDDRIVNSVDLSHEAEKIITIYILPQINGIFEIISKMLDSNYNFKESNIGKTKKEFNNYVNSILKYFHLLNIFAAVGSTEVKNLVKNNYRSAELTMSSAEEFHDDDEIIESWRGFLAGLFDSTIYFIDSGVPYPDKLFDFMHVNSSGEVIPPRGAEEHKDEGDTAAAVAAAVASVPRVEDEGPVRYHNDFGSGQDIIRRSFNELRKSVTQNLNFMRSLIDVQQNYSEQKMEKNTAFLSYLQRINELIINNKKKITVVVNLADGTNMEINDYFFRNVKSENLADFKAALDFVAGLIKQIDTALSKIERLANFKYKITQTGKETGALFGITKEEKNDVVAGLNYSTYKSENFNLDIDELEEIGDDEESESNVSDGKLYFSLIYQTEKQKFMADFENIVSSERTLTTEEKKQKINRRIQELINTLRNSFSKEVMNEGTSQIEILTEENIESQTAVIENAKTYFYKLNSTIDIDMSKRFRDIETTTTGIFDSVKSQIETLKKTTDKINIIFWIRYILYTADPESSKRKFVDIVKNLLLTKTSQLSVYDPNITRTLKRISFEVEKEIVNKKKINSVFERRSMLRKLKANELILGINRPDDLDSVRRRNEDDDDDDDENDIDTVDIGYKYGVSHISILPARTYFSEKYESSRDNFKNDIKYLVSVHKEKYVSFTNLDENLSSVGNDQKTLYLTYDMFFSDVEPIQTDLKKNILFNDADINDYYGLTVLTHLDVWTLLFQQQINIIISNINAFKTIATNGMEKEYYEIFNRILPSINICIMNSVLYLCLIKNEINVVKEKFNTVSTNFSTVSSVDETTYKFLYEDAKKIIEEMRTEIEEINTRTMFDRLNQVVDELNQLIKSFNRKVAADMIIIYHNREPGPENTEKETDKLLNIFNGSYPQIPKFGYSIDEFIDSFDFRITSEISESEQTLFNVKFYDAFVKKYIPKIIRDRKITYFNTPFKKPSETLSFSSSGVKSLRSEPTRVTTAARAPVTTLPVRTLGKSALGLLSAAVSTVTPDSLPPAAVGSTLRSSSSSSPIVLRESASGPATHGADFLTRLRPLPAAASSSSSSSSSLPVVSSPTSAPKKSPGAAAAAIAATASGSSDSTSDAVGVEAFGDDSDSDDDGGRGMGGATASPRSESYDGFADVYRGTGRASLIPKPRDEAWFKEDDTYSSDEDDIDEDDKAKDGSSTSIKCSYDDDALVENFKTFFGGALYDEIKYFTGNFFETEYEYKSTDRDRLIGAVKLLMDAIESLSGDSGKQHFLTIMRWCKSNKKNNLKKLIYISSRYIVDNDNHILSSIYLCLFKKLLISAGFKDDDVSYKNIKKNGKKLTGGYYESEDDYEIEDIDSVGIPVYKVNRKTKTNTTPDLHGGGNEIIYFMSPLGVRLIANELPDRQAFSLNPEEGILDSNFTTLGVKEKRAVIGRSHPIKHNKSHRQELILEELLENHLNIIKRIIIEKVIQYAHNSSEESVFKKFATSLAEDLEIPKETVKMSIMYKTIAKITDNLLNNFIKINIQKYATQLALRVLSITDRESRTYFQKIMQDIKKTGNFVFVTKPEEQYRITLEETIDDLVEIYESILQSRLQIIDTDSTRLSPIKVLHNFSLTTTQNQEDQCFLLEPNIVKNLLNKKSNVNKKDIQGNTPIFYAIENRHIELINILLENGASVRAQTAKNKMGYTPYEYLRTIYLELINTIMPDGNINYLTDILNEKIITKIRETPSTKKNILRHTKMIFPMLIRLINHMFYQHSMRLPKMWDLKQHESMIEALAKNLGSLNYFVNQPNSGILGFKDTISLSTQITDKIQEIKAEIRNINDQLLRIQNLDTTQIYINENIQVMEAQKTELEKKLGKLEKLFREDETPKIVHDENGLSPEIEPENYEYNNIYKFSSIPNYYNYLFKDVLNNKQHISYETDTRKYQELWNNYINTGKLSIFDIHVLVMAFTKTKLSTSGFSTEEYTLFKSFYDNVIYTVSDSYLTLPNEYNQNENPILYETMNIMGHVLKHTVFTSFYHIIIKLLYRHIRELNPIQYTTIEHEDESNKQQYDRFINETIKAIINTKKGDKINSTLLHYLFNVMPIKYLKSVLNIFDGEIDPDREHTIDRLFDEIINILIISGTPITLTTDSLFIINLKDYIFPYIKDYLEIFSKQMKTLCDNYFRFAINDKQYFDILGNLSNAAI